MNVRVSAAFALVLTVVSCGLEVCGQSTTDWLGLFQALVSRNPAVSEAARQRSFETLLPELVKKPADILEADVVQIVRAFQEEDQAVRLQASGFLTTLSMMRTDSTAALRAAIPALLAQFEDSNIRVRRNAVFAIVNLKPDMPNEALEPMLRMPIESDPETARAGLLGVARFSQTSQTAMETLKSYLSAGQSDRLRLATVQAVGAVALKDSGIITILTGILEDNDRGLVLETLHSLAQIGAAASAAGDRVERLAATHPDKEVAALARSVATRIR